MDAILLDSNVLIYAIDPRDLLKRSEPLQSLLRFRQQGKDA
jgi:hypothetical protein